MNIFPSLLISTKLSIWCGAPGNQRRAGDEAGTESEQIPELLGRAPAMQQVFRAIGRLSRSSVTVLITGESGTGKELVARALHDHSPRAAKPFIALNTSAIPGELLESELFGHERGSFTGADALRRGRFEQADGGTLFLDEIGDMSTPLQTRLLRVLAEGEFYRVGGQTPIRVDVRVIAATHQNLEDRVRRGLFREDLFHRLNVIRIELPPLRQRREDVQDLLGHYLGVAASELGVERKLLSADAAARLEQYDWPGNVRELVNLCRRLTVLAPGREIRLEDLPQEARGRHGRRWSRRVMAAGPGGPGVRPKPARGGTPLLDTALPAFERTLIRVRPGSHPRPSAGGGQVVRLGPEHTDTQAQRARHGRYRRIALAAAAIERGDREHDVGSRPGLCDHGVVPGIDFVVIPVCAASMLRKALEPARTFTTIDVGARQGGSGWVADSQHAVGRRCDGRSQSRVLASHCRCSCWRRARLRSAVESLRLGRRLKWGHP